MELISLKQEFLVDGQWVEFSEIESFYPSLFELANQKNSNGRSTQNANNAAAEISRLIACMPTRYSVYESLEFIRSYVSQSNSKVTIRS